MLSNIDDIGFDQVWKAGGLSSQAGDYFDSEDSIIVMIK